MGRFRYSMPCAFCRQEVGRGDTQEEIGRRYQRHLRNCGAFTADLQRARSSGNVKGDVPRDEVIQALLEKAGLVPPKTPAGADAGSSVGTGAHQEASSS